MLVYPVRFAIGFVGEAHLDIPRDSSAVPF